MDAIEAEHAGRVAVCQRFTTLQLVQRHFRVHMEVQPSVAEPDIFRNLDRRRHSATVFTHIELCGTTHGVTLASPTSAHQMYVKIVPLRQVYLRILIVDGIARRSF